MKQIKAIIIDDEPSAIETLKGMLGTFCPQIDVAAEARSVEDGLAVVLQHTPDLVFLDIEMPPFGKGFDLLKLLPNRSFGVVITTAYPNYAIQAINDVQPWGYLLKPYRVADLVQAVSVVEHKVTEQKSTAEKQGIIITDSRKGNIVVLTKDILYCKADGGATDMFILRAGKVEKITASRSLKELEEELPSSLFCRTHNSYLVNLQHVVRYQHTGRNGIIFLLHNQQAFISVLKMETFEERFKQFLEGG